MVSKAHIVFILFILILAGLFLLQSKSCGDSICAADEDCESCAQDCACPLAVECGDGVCHPDEDCSNCAADCGCSFGAYCDGRVCIEPTCGDDRCEPFESTSNCCVDCRCDENELCIDGTCQTPTFEISDAELAQVITPFLESRNVTFIEILESEPYSFDDRPARWVRVRTDVQNMVFVVTEEREVNYIPTY